MFLFIYSSSHQLSITFLTFIVVTKQKLPVDCKESEGLKTRVVHKRSAGRLVSIGAT